MLGPQFGLTGHWRYASRIRQPIADVADLQDTLANAKNSILLLVKRRGASLFVVQCLN